MIHQDRAPAIFEKQVKPVLEAAGLILKVHVTMHRRHATEILQDTKPGDYDAVVSIGGDGTTYEVLQGLLGRSDWDAMRRLPLVQVPCGSGNALAASTGLWDPLTAAFAIVRGATSALDIVSVLQPPGRRYYSFLSLTFGLIPNLDIGTEHLRWMGGTRFTVGALKQILLAKTHVARVAILEAGTAGAPAAGREDGHAEGGEAGAVGMAGSAAAAAGGAGGILPGAGGRVAGPQFDWGKVEAATQAGPSLQHIQEFHLLSDHASLEDLTLPPAWRWLPPAPLQLFATCNLPRLDMNFLLAPDAQLNSGHINLIYTAKQSRLRGLEIMTKAEKGQHMHLVQQLRVVALALEPVTTGTWLVVDGEEVPFQTVFLEEYCDDGYKFLSTYRHLINFHANDYYTAALWERIDPTWRPYLAQATEDDLHGCLAGVLASTAVLGDTAGSQTVSRRGGVNVKKQHEVKLLAEVISQLATALGVRTIVDVGAGKGFLAQQLAKRHGLSVLAIDMSSSLVQHAGQVARSREPQIPVTGLEAGTEKAGGGGPEGSRSWVGRETAGGPAQQAQHGAAAEPAAAGTGGGTAEGPPGAVQVVAVAATLTTHNAVPVLQHALRQYRQQQYQQQHRQQQQQQQQQQHGLAQVQQQQYQQQQAEQKGEPSTSPSHDTAQEGRESGAHCSGCQEERVIVVGLHACGDLTPALLRAFLAWPSAAAVVSLGCCYNLLTEAGDEQERMLSSAAAHPQGLGAIKPALGFSLGGAAHMAACHTVERLLAAGSQAAVPGTVQQMYRSLLNRYMQLYFADVPRSSLRLGRSRVKKKLARPAGMRLAASAQQQQRQLQQLELGRSQWNSNQSGSADVGSNRSCGEAEKQFPDAGSHAGSCRGCSQAQEHYPDGHSHTDSALEPRQEGGEPQRSHVGLGQPTAAGFVQYMEEALLKLGLQQEAPGPEAAAEMWQGEGAAWAPLLPALCMLRQVAGPVIESLILADRALYLLEGVLQQQGQPGKDRAGEEEEQQGGRPQQYQQPQGRCQLQEQAGEELQQHHDHHHQRKQQQQQDGFMGGGLPLAECCTGAEGRQAGKNDVVRLLNNLGNVHSGGGLHCVMFPLFNPVVSPRNTAILAVKL
ncbi:hypothetical protein N2152v2_001385 [Parachlorella kessleri]